MASSSPRNVDDKTTGLTLADEGIVVVEKVCSLQNSVQLKLAVVRRLARHHHCKRPKLDT